MPFGYDFYINYFQLDELVALVRGHYSASVQVAMVERLLEPPGSVVFDNITHTKTVATWINAVSCVQINETI